MVHGKYSAMNEECYMYKEMWVTIYRNYSMVTSNRFVVNLEKAMKETEEFVTNMRHRGSKRF